MFKPHTALITGGGTGIGRALAQAFVHNGTQVIIAGRRTDILGDLCKQHPGAMHPLALDVTDMAQVKQVAADLPKRFPQLDCVVNNAGVQRPFDLTAAGGLPLDFGDLEIDANLRGLLAVTAAFLPGLMRQKAASVINVSSGLAYVPLARVPVYCATKAAVRSWTLSLRYQLRKSSVRVIDIAPPAVSTELHDYMGAKGREVGIPVEQFIQETMEGLHGGALDVIVGHAKHLATGTEAAFRELNPP